MKNAITPLCWETSYTKALLIKIFTRVIKTMKNAISSLCWETSNSNALFIKKVIKDPEKCNFLPLLGYVQFQSPGARCRSVLSPLFIVWIFLPLYLNCLSAFLLLYCFILIYFESLSKFVLNLSLKCLWAPSLLKYMMVGRLCPALRQNCNPPGSGFCSCLVGLDNNEMDLLEYF